MGLVDKNSPDLCLIWVAYKSQHVFTVEEGENSYYSACAVLLTFHPCHYPLFLGALECGSIYHATKEATADALLVLSEEQMESFVLVSHIVNINSFDKGTHSLTSTLKHYFNPLYSYGLQDFHWIGT